MGMKTNGHPADCTCSECMAERYHHNQDMVAMELVGVASEGLTKQDILRRLAEHDLMDEMLVSDKYLDYALAFDKEGCKELCHKFCEMAKEEFSHAHIQRDILLEAGYSLTEAGEEKFCDLKERFKHTFR